MRVTWREMSRRQGGRCPLCGESLDNGYPCNIDHWIPKSLGGTNDSRNRQLVHAACNFAKGNVMYDSPLDPGIEKAVHVMNAHYVRTFESCEGGEGHVYPQPTVRFHGDQDEGHRALKAAMQEGLPVMELRRVWRTLDGETTGPWWELTFAAQ